MMKQFKRTVENFVCENCGNQIKGTGYTNHCSNCMHSKHVDVNPGDRLSLCKGLMEPVSFDPKQGILHRCKSCRFERFNKVEVNDNTDLLAELSSKVY